MTDRLSLNASPDSAPKPRSRKPRLIELWRLHRATDDLRGLAIETSFGYAFGLELDAELIVLDLHPTLEALVATSDRFETALIRRGWQLPHPVKKGHAAMTDSRWSRAAAHAPRRRLRRAWLLALAAVLLVPTASYAQASPWENAVNVLMTSFTGPIARGLSLVSIVVGGITFAFGEGGSKRLLAGIVFGVGMAIGAVNFMAWLFP